MRADWPFAVLLALYVLVALVVLWPDRNAGRRRRRGGSTRRSSPASTSASRATGARRATSTGCRPDGPPLGALDGQELRVVENRPGAPGFYSVLTATAPGGRTTAVRGLAQGADLSPFAVALLDYYRRHPEHGQP